jgi:fumarate reductase flavoprotein subunit
MLYDSAVKKGVEVHTGTPAVELIQNNGAVVGLKATNKNGDQITINAKAVILANVCSR